MSSLRLALKQSLENKRGRDGNYTTFGTNSNSTTDNLHANTPFGTTLSDKELRKLKKIQRLQEKAVAKERRREKQLKKLRRIKRKRRKEQREELASRVIEGIGGGLEIHSPVGNKLGVGGGGGGLGVGGVGGGSDGSSTLSSSSTSSSSSSSSSGSEESSSDDDDSLSSEDSSSSSSSSDSSSSSSSSSSDDDDDDDDDSSSSDDDDDSLSSSEEDGEVKVKSQNKRRDSDHDDMDDDTLKSSSSSSSDDSFAAADREAKELFDADMSSSSDEDEHVHHTDAHHSEDESIAGSADERRRQKRMEKKRKGVKKQKKKQFLAANMIQNHWKKKKTQQPSGGRDGEGKEKEEDDESKPPTSVVAVPSPPPPTTPTPPGKSTTKTVLPPTPQILSHIKQMPPKLARKSVQSGLRVKVRFVKKANINGRLSRKLKWYGGVISGVASGGKKVKISYDDGTSEIAEFPDKDIVIDDGGNGKHRMGKGGGWGGEAFRPEEDADGEEHKDDKGGDGGGSEEGEINDNNRVDNRMGDKSGEGNTNDDEEDQQPQAEKEGGKRKQQLQELEDSPEKQPKSSKKKKKKKKKRSSLLQPSQQDGNGYADAIMAGMSPGVGNGEGGGYKALKDGGAPQSSSSGGGIPKKLKKKKKKDKYNNSMSLLSIGKSKEEQQQQHQQSSTMEAARKGSPSDMSISSGGEMLAPMKTAQQPVSLVPMKETSTAAAAATTATANAATEEGEVEEGELQDMDIAMSGGYHPMEESREIDYCMPPPEEEETPPLGALGQQQEQQTATTPVAATGVSEQPSSHGLASLAQYNSDSSEVGEEKEEEEPKLPPPAEEGSSAALTSKDESEEEEEGEIVEEEEKDAMQTNEGMEEKHDNETPHDHVVVSSLPTETDKPSDEKKEIMGIDNENGSSSSGSTCSNSSFAGVDSAPGVGADDNKQEEGEVVVNDDKPTSSETIDEATSDKIDTKSLSSDATDKGGADKDGVDAAEKSIDGDVAVTSSDDAKEAVAPSIEKAFEESNPPSADETPAATPAGPEQPTAATAEADAKPKKKRGPLSIRINLPGAKRKKLEQEILKSKQPQEEKSESLVDSAEAAANQGGSSPGVEEPSKKKRKLSEELPEEQATEEEMEKEPPSVVETPAVEADAGVDESLSDGEIQEEGEIQENEEEGEIQDDENKMEVDTDKTAGEAPVQAKKHKLSIHISTKKRKLKQEKDKPTVEADSEPVLSEEMKKETSEQSTEMVDAGLALEGGKSPKEPSTLEADADETTPVPEEAADDGKGGTYTMARSGRKAAKLAAEKLHTEKRTKRKKDKGGVNTGIKKKAEEDPWAQCDRCHKWRHLPGNVNLDSLPEHWFCELNTFDPKRNNCEAPEQTPKEVAKEKKRAKKLALKKLQKEQADAAREIEASEVLPRTKGKKGRSTSPKNMGSDQETEFDSVKVNSADDEMDARASRNTTEDDDDETTTNVTRSEEQPVKPKPKRGRPRREDKDRSAAVAPTGKGKDKDGPKQEWVQCEKCEKWRRLPPRISAEDLPDVWFCSMNTWDINLATCTAVEDKHEANSPQRGAANASGGNSQTQQQYNEQSQLPTNFAGGSSSKLSYRNLIFGSGRRQKNISERMRAQESLFGSYWQDDEVDMSVPPTVGYAHSNAFYNKNLQKAASFGHEDGAPVDESGARPPRTSIFDIVSGSRVWQELNNNAATVHSQSSAAYGGVGYDKYCLSSGDLNQEAIDALKAMAYVSLGTKKLVGHELLLQVQGNRDWNVPDQWLELRSLCTIEIMNFILGELIKDGLVDATSGTSKSHSLLENTFYCRREVDTGGY